MSARFRLGPLATAAAGLLVLLTALPAVASGHALTDAPRAQQTWLAGLNVPQAWRLTRGSGVTVAVLSTGVFATHPDLTGSVLTGPDYTQSGRSAGGPFWGTLGTAVASIIAGHGHGPRGTNGILGIAPAAKILSVRVNLEYNDPLNSSAAITRRLPGAIAAGIRYAVAHGAKVIDLPLDPADFQAAGASAAAGGSAAEAAAVRAALAAGVVLIAPGGDDGPGAGRVNYPAAYPGVIAVAALDRQGRLAEFTARRPYVTLSAPGVSLLTASLVPGARSVYVPGYTPISTSSVASAMVAGVAALIVSRYPGLTAAQVGRALAQAATGPGKEINAGRAMAAAQVLANTAARSSPSASPSAPATARQPATRPAPHSAVASPAARPASADTAGTALRDAVYVLGVLIAILAGVVLITRSRRAERARVPPAADRGPRPRGQHEQRRDEGEQAPADGHPGRGHTAAGHTGAGYTGAGYTGAGYTDADTVTFRLRRLADPGSPAAGGWPAVPTRPGQDIWRGGEDWQGRGIGEIAHVPGEFPDAAIQPMPRSHRREQPGTPPWAPAPEPPDDTGPLPLRRSSLGLAAAPVSSDYPAPPDRDADGPAEQPAR